MRIQNIKYIFVLALVFLALGCKKSKFTPPEDGIVTEKMATRYVTVSLALTKITEDEAVKLAELRKKHGISSSLVELDDEEYKEKYPVVVAAWDSLREDWNRKQDSVYKVLNMPEEEWTWIAEAIISYGNKEIRQFIIKEFERLKEETDSLPKQAKDSN